MRGGTELQYDFIDNAIATIILDSKYDWMSFDLHKYHTCGGFTNMNK